MLQVNAIDAETYLGGGAGGARPPLFFAITLLQELQTVLFEVELIINNKAEYEYVVNLRKIQRT